MSSFADGVLSHADSVHGGHKLDKSRIAFAKAVIKRTAAKLHGTTVSGRALPKHRRRSG
jgi:hypothetical protein